MPSHLEAVARRKLTPLPEGWESFRYLRIGPDATQLTGGVPRLLKSGPRKGEKRWDGPSQTAVVTDAEVAAEFARYERETGHCGGCLSAGEVSNGWSITNGHRLKVCRRCNGTGNAPVPTSEAQAAA